MSDREEKKIDVDPVTGAQKETRLARFDLIPEDVMWALAEHYGRGAKKYADRNWEKGYKWSNSYAALRRHMAKFWMGEDIDAETGSHHMIAAAWHCIALVAFSMRGIGTDDRAKASFNRAEEGSQNDHLMTVKEIVELMNNTLGGQARVS